jgi:peroxiredoxin
MFGKSLVALFLVAAAVYGSPPKVGDRAPDFSLPTAAGATAALKDFAGKSKVVLVFYRGYW